MKISELNYEQLSSVKQRYDMDKIGRELSLYEIWDIDEIVSDAEIFEAEADTEFSADDFCCE